VARQSKPNFCLVQVRNPLESSFEMTLSLSPETEQDRFDGNLTVFRALAVVAAICGCTAFLLFAAKVPQVITHEKVLVDCETEFKQFIEVMDNLAEKLGPLLLQFGFFNNSVFRGVSDFVALLRPFLKILPKDHKFVIEIRNKHWLVPQFIETLREHGVALALIDQFCAEWN
jgi:hypothetical protein